MASTVAARRTLAGFFLQESVPSAKSVASFNRKRIAAGLVALDPTTFAADTYGRAVARDACITSGQPYLSSASIPFTAADVGKKVYVQGAGAAGATLVARIAAFNATSTVTLDTNAATTVDGSVGTSTAGIACWGYSRDQSSSDGSEVQTTGAIPTGGTTGQVLAKTSNSDRAVAWADAGSLPTYVLQKDVSYDWDDAYPGVIANFFQVGVGANQTWEVDFLCFPVTPYPGGSVYLAIGCDDAVAGRCSQAWEHRNGDTNPTTFMRGGNLNAGLGDADAYASMIAGGSVDRRYMLKGKAYVRTGPSATLLYLFRATNAEPLPGAGVLFLPPTTMVARRLE